MLADHKKRLCLPIMAMVLLCCGCSRNTSPEIGTAQVLKTETGNKKIEGEGCWADFSETDQGYITVNCADGSVELLFEVIGTDGAEYKYYVSPEDGDTVLPLTVGDGEYRVAGYQHLSGNNYLTVLDGQFKVSLDSEFLPFLYPNQFVDFDEDSEVVVIAGELTENCTTQMEKLEAIYRYVVDNITYDYDLAESVETGYLPDLDSVLEKRKGICFDYSSLTCAMLRCQGIPAKLQIGTTGSGTSHAWCEVYLEEGGILDDVIQIQAGEWNLIDTTQMAAASTEDEKMLFLQYCQNYVLSYTR